MRADMFMESKSIAELSAVEKYFSLISSLREAKSDVGIKELALFLDISPSRLNIILSNEKKFLEFLKNNEEKIQKVITECRNNAVEGKRILSQLLDSGVSSRKVARFLGYRGNDYDEFFRRLKEKKFWGYSLFERVNSAQVFFLGFSESEIFQSDFDYVLFVTHSSLMFASLFRIFVFLDCYQKKVVTFRQVIKAVLDFCDYVVEEYEFSYGAVLYVLFELMKNYAKCENIVTFGMLYLKQNRKKTVIEEVKRWLKDEDEEKKEKEKKVVLKFLSLFFSFFVKVNGLVVDTFPFLMDLVNNDESATVEDVVMKLNALRLLSKDKKRLEQLESAALDVVSASEEKIA